MRKLIAAVAMVLCLAPTAALAGATSTLTCTTAAAHLSGFPSRGVHTVYAYFGGDATGQLSKSFTGTSSTLVFTVPQGGVASGESYSVLVSWKGSQGGTKPAAVSFSCP